MNKKTLFLVPLLFIGYTASTLAAGYDCAAKRLEVETLIQKSGDAANPGLETALQELVTHCTDTELLSKAQKKLAKLERKALEKQGDIDEAKSDLAEATAEGKTLKISKYQHKIKSKESDLEAINVELEEQKNIVKELQRTK